MSCENCEEIQDRGDIAYVRIGKANVGIVGCDEHLQILFGQMKIGREVGALPADIQPVRVLAKPENKKFYE